MKVIILHGDYLTKSYTRLTKFIEIAKSRGWEIVEDVIETTPSLFDHERLFVFRGYQKLSKDDIKNLSKFPGTLVIYQEGVIPALFLKNLPKDTKIERYDLPKLIWNFLDNPNVKMLHQVIKHEPVEFVFAILAKRFRDLYRVATDPKTLPYQDWQISRLKKQASQYSTRRVGCFIKELAQIDIDAKTSKVDLLPALDFFLITRLK